MLPLEPREPRAAGTRGGGGEEEEEEEEELIGRCGRPISARHSQRLARAPRVEGRRERSRFGRDSLTLARTVLSERARETPPDGSVRTRAGRQAQR